MKYVKTFLMWFFVSLAVIILSWAILLIGLRG